MENESILRSIVKLLGPGEDYDYFDPDIILHINSAFARLCELGVGPKEKPFTVHDASAVWSDFDPSLELSQVRTYIYLSVKIIFDPPASSTIMETYKKEIDKLEYLLCNVAEFGY